LTLLLSLEVKDQKWNTVYISELENWTFA
jgi:hypothetical protein